jgi:acetyl-CoA carboxylase alpha subunit
MFLLFQIISFNMEMCESVLITVVELEGEVKRLRKHVEEEEEELQAQLEEWEDVVVGRLAHHPDNRRRHRSSFVHSVSPLLPLFHALFERVVFFCNVLI